mgnify:CR=1 FL=1
MFWPVFVFLLANVYVVSSWWCWWYGGSYGQRAFIESYAVLALPLAALIQWGLGQGSGGASAVLCVAGALVLHNGFQMIQLKSGALHMENMTRAAYFKTWGRVQPSQEFKARLRVPDFAAARQGRSESEWNNGP